MRKIILVFFLILVGCGFKVVNQSKQINFSVLEINTSGDKKINYNLRNKLYFLMKNEKEQKVVLNLKSKKIKSIKEKNIKNEITKYTLVINTTVQIINKGKFDQSSFNLSLDGEYNVAQRHSQTINNEKKLVKLLSDNMADQILIELAKN